MIYRGSHDYWNKSFTGTNATMAQGFLKFKAGPLDFHGGATFTLLHNYIYFRQDTTKAQTVLSYQSSGNQSTFAPEVRFSIQFLKHFYFRPQAIYTTFLANDDNALSIPQVFVNGQLAYENLLFKKHLQLQAGVDVHWKSAYHALGYDLAIQQFYLQDAFVSPAYPLVDVFVTGKMRRARFFFMFHNLVQTFTHSGYMPTPGYPGQKSVVDFGFDFLLFD